MLALIGLTQSSARNDGQGSLAWPRSHDPFVKLGGRSASFMVCGEVLGESGPKLVVLTHPGFGCEERGQILGNEDKPWPC